MSARLIKRGGSTVHSAFVPRTLPSTEATSEVTSTLSGTVMPFAAQLPTSIPTPALLHNTANGAGLSAHMMAASETEADTFIEEAQAEAERLIANARAHAAEIERDAREQGLREGHAMAAAEVSRLAEPLRERLVQSLEEVAGLREAIAATAERELVRLAIEIAKKIVHREVTVDSEVALTLARVALARLHNRAVATVHLHPEDFAYVQAHCGRLGANTSIEIVEDQSIGRGGCLVQTEMGDVDARIERQFAEIERSFGV